MEYNLLPYLESCREVFRNAATLVYYTHIPSAVLASLFGTFVCWKKRDVTSLLFAIVSYIFAVYTTLDLILWSQTDKNTVILFTWSLFGLLSGMLFFFMHWFVHKFVVNKPLPLYMAIVWLVLLSPIFILTPTQLNTANFDIANCAATEGVWFTNYYYAIGLVAMVLIALSGYEGLRSKNVPGAEFRSASILVVIGAELFLAFFLITGFLASYLVSANIIPDFGVDQYGIATMTVFISILAYATVRYRAFNLKLLAAQALVVSLIILIASEFLFVVNPTNKILTAITLALAIVFGFFLVRSVKKEVLQRELIEKQEKELEVINAQQEGLLHFISHEIKGYLTKNEAGFAAIAEGDYGAVPAPLKTMAESALVDTRRGVDTVMDILDASNLKKGTVSYDKKQFDFGVAVADVVSVEKASAQEKGLFIEFVNHAFGSYTVDGDENKIRRNVIRNIIDNSIRYTPSGSIHVELSKVGASLRLTVSDTGVGITPEDMRNLFKEGGHGKDSIKTNVHSTGYGLYIAKSIVEAHGGKIWAESEGKDKGSRFIVELPLAS